MIREMGSRSQLLDWKTFFENEPFGERRDDYRTALLASILCNRGLKNPIPVEKFLLSWSEPGETPEPLLPPPTKRDWRQLKEIGSMWVTVINAEEEMKVKRLNG